MNYMLAEGSLTTLSAAQSTVNEECIEDDLGGSGRRLKHGITPSLACRD